MAIDDSKQSKLIVSPEMKEEMEKYGITRVLVDYFHYKEFRYTSLKDAVNQARRQQRKG